MSVKLINDKKEQAFLKAKTKFLIEETLTLAIEVIEGKTIEDWDVERKEQVNSHSSFPKYSFAQMANGKKVVEYCDAVKILKEYYASSAYSSGYKSKIIEAQKCNEEFVPSQFRKEFDIQCEKERSILSDLATTRNKEMVHNVEEANMGEIYIWIRQLMRYLEIFIGYRMQVLSRYDNNFGKVEDIELLEEFYTKASELKEECFASKDNYKEFRFGRNIYKVNKEDKEDFPLLISDMARRWERGIEYLKIDKFKKSFDEVLAEYVEDFDVVLEYEKKYQKFKKTSVNSIEESIYYMAILYTIFPNLSGLYWKGKRYSDSYFASLVLQVLTRHPNKYSEEDKRLTLQYRINNFREWNEMAENKTGLGIDLILFCQEKLLSLYFKGQGNEKGVSLTQRVEEYVLKCVDMSFLNENYDAVIEAVLCLTAYMKGRVTYVLPVPEEHDGEKIYRSFRTPEEFQNYFLQFSQATENLEEIAKFVHCVRHDNNLAWFIKNYNLYERN